MKNLVRKLKTHLDILNYGTIQIKKYLSYEKVKLLLQYKRQSTRISKISHSE